LRCRKQIPTAGCSPHSCFAELRRLRHQNEAFKLRFRSSGLRPDLPRCLALFAGPSCALHRARLSQNVDPSTSARKIMNIQDDPGSWALEKFGVGQPVPRTEDPKLVRGLGRYSDDLSLPRQAYAVIVRSSHAHGLLKGIDTSA